MKMKARISISLPLNVEFYTYNGVVVIIYHDGPLHVKGMGQDFWNAMNDFRIEFAKAIHQLANKA